jgi:hypothetical protein
MIYGHGGTIHGTEHLDVEVDSDGSVVSVWFRCMALPFQQTLVDRDRAAEMVSMYKNRVENYRLNAVDVDIPK